MTKNRQITSEEAEICILGSLLSSVNAVNCVVETLIEENFFSVPHQVIFRAIKRLYSRNVPVDIVTVSDELRFQKELESVGNVEYLMRISNFSEPFYNLDQYLKTLKDKYIRRKLLEVTRNVFPIIQDEDRDISTILDLIQKNFHEIGQNSNLEQAKKIKEILDGTKSEIEKPFLTWVEEMQERVRQGLSDADLLSGVSTGFIDLDKLIDGLGASNLIILAGRPGMGKTTFALNLVLNALFKSEVPVCFFSLEMTGLQITKKLVFAQAEIPENDVKKTILNPRDFQSVVAANGLLSQKDLFIEDPPKLNIFQLKSRARRLKQVYDIKLIVIDYLQLITSDMKFPNRQEEVAMISKELKSLARELNVPVVCLAQLSRKVEERESKVPVMSDLRESGAIEQDSDVILFINRRDYHNPSDKPGLAEIIVGKNRHGETGKATLAFKKEIGKFENSTFKLPDQDGGEDEFNETLKKGW